MDYAERVGAAGEILDPKYSWLNGYGATALGGLNRMQAVLDRVAVEQAGRRLAAEAEALAALETPELHPEVEPVTMEAPEPTQASAVESPSLRPTSLQAIDDLVLLDILQLLPVADLARLRCVSMDFWRCDRQAAGWQGRGFVEEAAKIMVTRRADRHLAPLRAQCVGTESWLRILSELRELTTPLAFTAVHERLRTTPDGRTLLKSGQGGDYQGAFCHRAVMRAGIHRVDFKIVRYNGDVCIGVALAVEAKTAAARTIAATAVAGAEAGGWGLAAYSGKLRHAGCGDFRLIVYCFLVIIDQYVWIFD